MSWTSAYTGAVFLFLRPHQKAFLAIKGSRRTTIQIFLPRDNGIFSFASIITLPLLCRVLTVGPSQSLNQISRELDAQFGMSNGARYSFLFYCRNCFLELFQETLQC